MRISDWSSDVCSSDLTHRRVGERALPAFANGQARHVDLPQKLDFRLSDDEATCRVYRADEDRHLTALHVRIAQCCHCGGVRRIKPDGDFRRFLTDLFGQGGNRSEEHTSELQSTMRISYAVFCLKKKHTSPTNLIEPL